MNYVLGSILDNSYATIEQLGRLSGGFCIRNNLFYSPIDSKTEFTQKINNFILYCNSDRFGLVTNILYAELIPLYHNDD